MTQSVDNTDIFMAFCNETRLKVLELLQSGEQCANMLLEQVKVGQSTLSHHMKILIKSGIVTLRNAGKQTYYSICESGLQNAVEFLKKLTASKESEAVEQ